jgi:hypothetical protein
VPEHSDSVGLATSQKPQKHDDFPAYLAQLIFIIENFDNMSFITEQLRGRYALHDGVKQDGKHRFCKTISPVPGLSHLSPYTNKRYGDVRNERGVEWISRRDSSNTEFIVER